MDFYRINEEYNQYPQRYEKEKRGVTKVPNIRYTDRNKFAFGAVMQVNGINYYVSVSSFDTKQEANILIRIPGDEKEIKGSLRFNYMIPVPEECIERLVIKDVEDEKYRLLLNKEYQFCMDNAERIQKKANKIDKWFLALLLVLLLVQIGYFRVQSQKISVTMIVTVENINQQSDNQNCSIYYVLPCGRNTHNQKCIGDGCKKNTSK